MFLATILAFMIASTRAQIPGTGPCKELTPMKNFNGTKYLGTWYEYASYPHGIRGRCERQTMTRNPDGTITWVAKQLTLTGKPAEWETVVFEVKAEGPSYVVTYPEDLPTFNMTILILSTDYVSYAIKGYCENVGPSSLNTFWIMTRTLEEPSQKTLERVSQTLKDEGIPEEYFVKEDRTNCSSF